jgi:L-threonylcarbamoyladenylate synthase
MKRIQFSKWLSDTELEFSTQCLKNGEVICYPTETFYALGADPWSEEARKKVFALKGREVEKDLPLIAGDVEMVAEFCDVRDSRFLLLAERFWPGPLTMVLKAGKGSGASYAVRVSSHPVAVQLSAHYKGPIISTSANLSGEDPVSDPGQLPSQILEGIAVLIDGGQTPGGKPSTIISLIEPETKLLREGTIPWDLIRAIL